MDLKGVSVIANIGTAEQPDYLGLLHVVRVRKQAGICTAKMTDGTSIPIPSDKAEQFCKCWEHMLEHMLPNKKRNTIESCPILNI